MGKHADPMAEARGRRHKGIGHRRRQRRAQAVFGPRHPDETTLGKSAGELLHETEDHRQRERMRRTGRDASLDELGERVDRQVDHRAGRQPVDGVDEDDGRTGADEVVRHQRADVADVGQRSRGGGQQVDDSLGDRIVTPHRLTADEQCHASHGGHLPVTLRSRKWVAQLMHGS